MSRTLSRTIAPLALVALLVAGCGGDDKSGSTSNGSTPAATATDGAPTSTQATTGGGSLADNPQIKAAIERCKSSIQDNPAVKADIKDDLKSICDKAATGKPEDVKAAIKAVCTKIIESSVPAGTTRDQAVVACNNVTG